MKTLFKKYLNSHLFPLSILVILAIVSHPQWFNFNSIIAWGDWTYWPRTVVGRLVYLWSPWINFIDLGYPNTQVNYFLFIGIWGFLAKIGIGYDISSKLTMFMPIVLLSFISPYILSYKLSGDKKIASVVALFYGTTTYGLFVQQPIQFVYSLAPLIIFLFIKAIEKQKLFNWLLFNLLFWIGVCYEPRVMIIISFILLIFFILTSVYKSRRIYLFILFSLVVQLALNAFWLLPLLTNQSSSGVGQLISRGIFGDNLQDILHAFTIYIWQWTGSYPNDVFVQQDVKPYFWFFPILAFSVFLFKNLKERTMILSFGIIAIVGIFLSKQSSLPIINSYRFFYQFVPGFSIFREATKFYLLVSIGYLGLITYSLKYMKRQHKTSVLICFIILISACLFTLRPFFTGEIGTLFVSRKIPNDYLVLSKTIERQKTFFRVLWIPAGSSWTSFNDTHPAINVGVLYENNFDKIVKNKNQEYSQPELFKLMLEGKYGKKILSENSIKYIVVPLEENRGDFLRVFGKNREYYTDELSKIYYLKRINFGKSNLAIFENKNFASHFYLSSAIDSNNYTTADPLIISANRYQLNKIPKNTILNFSEVFSPSWKIRIGKFDLFQSLYDKNYYLPDKYHLRNSVNLNSFYIRSDANKIEEPSLTVTIFYQPMIYFYIGLLISAIAFIISLCLILIFTIKGLRKK